MNFVGNTLSAIFVWVMIPLTLLSGTPLGGCVCANGQHRFFCQRLNSGNGDSASTTACSCCHIQSGPNAAANRRSTCCALATRSLPKGKEQGVSTRCCHRFVEIPSPSTVAEKFDAGDDEAVPLFLPSVADVTCPAVAQGARQIGSRRDLPPPDLVMLHHAFLI